jgi:hypothetical protein
VYVGAIPAVSLSVGETLYLPFTLDTSMQ